MIKSLLKDIYSIAPFKQEIYSALRLFWKPSQSIYRHLHFKGVIDVKVDEKRSFKMKHYGFQIENSIFWSGLLGYFEKDSLSLWIRLCENSEVIFDLGANTGIYSLVAKTIKPASKVYAFEPVSRVFSKLRENIEINKFDIVAVEKAVSDADGTAIIRDTNTEHTYSVTVNAQKVAGDGRDIETQIPIVKLDTYIRENKISKIDLMKIDVETHEPEVLKGFSDYLFKFRPSILIEITNPEVGEKIDAIMKGSGYLYFNIDEKGGIRREDKIIQSDHYNYLMCVPEVAKKIGLIP